MLNEQNLRVDKIMEHLMNYNFIASCDVEEDQTNEENLSEQEKQIARQNLIADELFMDPFIP